jgi:hypothetical protein
VHARQDPRPADRRGQGRRPRPGRHHCREHRRGDRGGDREGQEGPPERKPPWDSDDDFDPERAAKLLENLRDDLDKIKGERDDLRTKVQEHEDATKSDTQKLEERATKAEARAAAAENSAARLRVALNKGLTETQAKRLVGDSEEDLEKDADELLSSFRAEDDEGRTSVRVVRASDCGQVPRRPSSRRTTTQPPWPKRCRGLVAPARTTPSHGGRAVQMTLS